MSAPFVDPYQLGAAMREARKARGWTQQELADRAGVSRQLLLDLERGKRPRVELIRVLALVKALDLAVVLVPSRSEPFDSALERATGKVSGR